MELLFYYRQTSKSCSVNSRHTQPALLCLCMCVLMRRRGEYVSIKPSWPSVWTEPVPGMRTAQESTQRQPPLCLSHCVHYLTLCLKNITWIKQDWNIQSLLIPPPPLTLLFLWKLSSMYWPLSFLTSWLKELHICHVWHRYHYTARIYFSYHYSCWELHLLEIGRWRKAERKGKNKRQRDKVRGGGV